MRKSPNYWTYERISVVALKCETRTEFCDTYKGAYKRARINGWLDEICVNMKLVGNLRKRLVYSYEFLNNSVYIGITCNEKRRNRQHYNEKGIIKNQIIKSKSLPIKKILSEGYVNVEEAQKLEGYWVHKYKNDGWDVLNKIKAGGLGGNIIYWTKENCKKVALQCKTRKEFSIKFSSAYISSRKNGWLNEICGHMKRIRKPQGHWNYNNCKNVASNCKTRFDFSRKYSGAYFVSNKNKWLDDFYQKI